MKDTLFKMKTGNVKGHVKSILNAVKRLTLRLTFNQKVTHVFFTIISYLKEFRTLLVGGI